MNGVGEADRTNRRSESASSSGSSTFFVAPNQIVGQVDQKGVNNLCTGQGKPTVKTNRPNRPVHAQGGAIVASSSVEAKQPSVGGHYVIK